jgi:hypothetical protein
MIQDGLSAEAKDAYELEVADHRHLVGKLQDIELWLDNPAKTASWTETLSATLDELCLFLRSHFQREESSPIFVEVPLQFPRFARNIDRLLGEHESFVEDIERIIDDLARSGELSEPRKQEICCRTRLLIASLRRHESEENEIMQRAYCEDIGACD